ncbi:hypothetical protein ACFOG5_01260 [Pedobacter fastidiosus]
MSLGKQGRLQIEWQQLKESIAFWTSAEAAWDIANQRPGRYRKSY